MIIKKRVNTLLSNNKNKKNEHPVIQQNRHTLLEGKEACRYLKGYEDQIKIKPHEKQWGKKCWGL